MVSVKWFNKPSMKILLLVILILLAMFSIKSFSLIYDLPASTADTPVTKEPPVIDQVEFWAISSADNQNEVLLEQLVAQFNTEHDTIHVNLEMKSDRYFYKTFATAMASQTNPDVRLINNSQAIQFADKGFLFSLDSVISNITNGGKIFYPQALEQTKLYNQYYAIPLTIENYILVIRKDIFDRNGMDTPESLFELLSALRIISENEKIAGLALPSDGNLFSRALLHFILINGGKIIDSDGNIQLNSSKNMETYEFINTLFREELVYTAETNLSIADVSNIFINGDAAAVLTTPTSLKTIYNRSNNEFIQNIEIVSYVKAFDDEFYNCGPVFTQVLCIYKNSQRKDEAQVFVAWLSNNYSELLTDSHYDEISANITYMDNIILTQDITSKIFQEILPNTVSPTYPEQNYVNYIVVEGTDVLNDFMYGLSQDIEVSELTAQYQQTITKWENKFTEWSS